ncbi:MAG: hypothetical protein MUF27_00360 [Acidobacteria bacterium]|jgi:hypothetical protein|nr:hypothetical protein [Acidobacteriota bacterium]
MSPPAPRASRRPRLAGWSWCLALALVAVAAGGTTAARAQHLNGFAELQGTEVEETQFPLPGAETDSWRGRLSLTYSHQLWPNIQFQAGGLFEQLRGRADLFGIETESEFTQLLPFVIFRWQTPTNDAQLGWQRNEFRRGGGGATTARLVRDTYGITLGWTPEPSSFVRASYYRSDDRDGGRELFDRQTDRMLLLAGYRPIDPLALDYRGAWSWEDNQAEDTKIDTTSQNLRITFGDSYWDQRLMVSASYDVSWRQVETQRGSPGEVSLPVVAIRGLSALTDLPSNITLAPNPALIDANREVSAGVNLGVPRPSDDRSLRNIGFDFEIPRAVNSIRVWVDRDLPLEISQTLTWEIWSSADNIRWTRQRTLGSAPFAPFDNYFELRFGAIAARYLKVVVAPLSPGVPNAQEYATINVTELEAALYREVPGTGFRNQTTDQRIYAGSQLILTRKPYLTWDVTYTASIPDETIITDTLSNVLSLSYQINPIWLVNARAGYETGRSIFGRRNGTLYGATVTATPIPTFSATLSASGQRERYERGVDQDTDSLFLNTTTNLYEGINLLVGGGLARTQFIPGATIDTTTASAALELLPNPALSLVLGYDLIRDERTGGAFGDGDSDFRSGVASLSWNPVPSFYFFGSYRIERSGQLPEPRRLTTTSINWSPFPLGTLRFSLRYDDYYDTLLDSRVRNWGPGLRWYLNPISYLDFYWEMYTSESTLSEYERETLAATLRVGF